MNLFKRKNKDAEVRSCPCTEPQANEPEDSCVTQNVNLFSLFNQTKSTRQNSTVFACTELISSSLACMPLRVVEIDENGLKSPVRHHPLNLIFHDRNVSNMSFFHKIKCVVYDVIAHGDGFLYISHDTTGLVSDLRYLKHCDVNIVYDEKKDLLYYQAPKVSNKPIMPRDMLHFLLSSKDGIHGESIVGSALDTIRLQQDAEAAAKRYFSSGCTVDGLLIPKQQTKEEQRRQIAQTWQQNARSSNIQVLPFGLEYKEIGSNQKDSQGLENREFLTKELCRYFQVNPALIGDFSNATYNTLEQINLAFLQHTLYPYVKMLEREFTRKLCADSDDLVIDIDQDSYLLKTDKTSTAQFYSTLLQQGVLSINEVRQKLDLPQIENGDEHYAMYQDASKASIKNVPNQN